MTNKSNQVPRHFLAHLAGEELERAVDELGEKIAMLSTDWETKRSLFALLADFRRQLRPTPKGRPTTDLWERARFVALLTLLELRGPPRPDLHAERKRKLAQALGCAEPRRSRKFSALHAQAMDEFGAKSVETREAEFWSWAQGIPPRALERLTKLAGVTGAATKTARKN